MIKQGIARKGDIRVEQKPTVEVTTKLPEQTEFEGLPGYVRLSSIAKDANVIMVLFLRWIEFMIERVGYYSLEVLLNYYVEIGWISKDVMFTVLKYTKGIKLYHENSDWRPVGVYEC